MTFRLPRSRWEEPTRPCERPIRSSHSTANSGGTLTFLLYAVGFIVLVSGFAWLATVVGIAPTYVMVGAAILLALGLVTAATRRRARHPA